MTKDQIIAMAREAGYDMEAGQRIGESSDIELFTRFASLVAAQAAAEEREACAKVCEEAIGKISEAWIIGFDRRDAGVNTCKNLAAAIRERK